MARAYTHPPFRAPGGGRPPNPFPEPDPPILVFVEGRVPLDLAVPENVEKLSRLRSATEALGLVAHSPPIVGEGEEVRKTWGTRRIDMDVAVGWVRDYPGITFLKWAEAVFLAGDPMNAFTFAAAKAKARVALSRLSRAGKIVKRKDDYGQLTLWASGSPAKPRPGALPADFAAEVDQIVATALKPSRFKKATTTLEIARAVADRVWAKRLTYSESGE